MITTAVLISMKRPQIIGNAFFIYPIQYKSLQQQVKVGFWLFLVCFIMHQVVNHLIA